MREDGEMARRAELEEFCRKHDLKMCTIAELISYRLKREQFVKRSKASRSPPAGAHSAFTPIKVQSIPSRTCAVQTATSANSMRGKVICRRAGFGSRHSECLTGDIFGSAKCDCGPQLDAAMQQIEAAGKGVLVFSARSRGIGLANKLHAYALQEKASTPSSQPPPRPPVDKRDYVTAANPPRPGLRQIRIMTNNPKNYGIEGYGLTITKNPHPIEPGEFNKAYLETKRAKLGHKL